MGQDGSGCKSTGPLDELSQVQAQGSQIISDIFQNCSESPDGFSSVSLEGRWTELENIGREKRRGKKVGTGEDRQTTNGKQETGEAWS